MSNQFRKLYIKTFAKICFRQGFTLLYMIQSSNIKKQSNSLFDLTLTFSSIRLTITNLDSLRNFPTKKPDFFSYFCFSMFLGDDSRLCKIIRQNTNPPAISFTQGRRTFPKAGGAGGGSKTPLKFEILGFYCIFM